MCSKALQPNSLVDVFEIFLSSAATTVDEEKGNPLWQPCADFYITCILSCLPWGGAELVEVITWCHNIILTFQILKKKLQYSFHYSPNTLFHWMACHLFTASSWRYWESNGWYRSLFEHPKAYFWHWFILFWEWWWNRERS